MTKARSPEYPAIGLKTAIDQVKLVYEKDYQNKLPKKVIAEHMGYKGISGTSLTVLAALSKYGLLEGRGDETRVSDLALAIIAHGPGTPERIEAIRTAASAPELFGELAEKFPNGKASDSAIRAYLLTEKFLPEAADTVIRSYRETMQLVESESLGYTPPPQKSAEQPVTMPSASPVPKQSATPPPPLIPKPGMLQEVFVLDEGPVSLTFPADLSPESYEDLEAHLQLILRKAKRRAVIDPNLRSLSGKKEAAD